MKKVETEAKTREEAVAKALAELGVDDENLVKIEVLQAQGSGGLLGIFGSRNVRIRATIKPQDIMEEIQAPEEKSEPEPEPEEREPRPRYRPEQKPWQSRPPESGSEHGHEFEDDEAAREDRSGQPEPDSLVNEFFNLFSQGVKIDKDSDEEYIYYRVTRTDGPDLGYLIGKHGATLNAIQYLLNTMAIRKKMAPRKIVVDIEMYREKRRQYLESLAATTAEKVLKRRKEVVLSSLLPHERKIIHTVLGNEPEIGTYSRGEGSARKLVVYPKSRRRE